jgi:hypothetical protein
MPEWADQPANQYLPRRKTEARIEPAQLVREQNPLRVEGREPAAGGPLGADWEH